MIHIVKGFGVVNKAEIDVFLELSCFFDDPVDVGNLISGSTGSWWRVMTKLGPLEKRMASPMNSMKRQKDRTLKGELPRLVGAQYATEISGEITPKTMKGWSKSKNITQL